MTIKRDARGRKRDYRREYLRDHASTKAKKQRAARNRVRRRAIARGAASKGDGTHVDHIVPLSKGGSTGDGNTRVVSAKTNLKKARSMPTRRKARTRRRGRHK
ncbi:MAG: HNH endonuclease signature motif containing protein [Planctomycetota bacterium]|jgi:hypothetical protein|nr:HNH endonuclease signature motif containing protein [Planctomycetota bacterium]